MSLKVYLAVDIGAGSGRVLAGCYDGNTLTIETVRRFGNRGISLPTGWHWNLPQLFADIVAGIGEAKQKFGDALVSISVDTWGVDYGLLDAHGRLLGLPWMYRDSRADGLMSVAAERLPREEIFSRTGIAALPFNSIFQLMAEQRDHPGVLREASKLLFMPDLIAYWLSGEAVCERTIASTSMMLKAGRPEWDIDLVETLGVPAHFLLPITEPCLPVGNLRPEIARETGCHGLQVVTCGGHDTASAVAGVPSIDACPLFLSSGTWSLLGCELPAPVLTSETFAAGFSNEHGLEGTTRFLKNVTGMWLIQECRRNWELQARPISDGDLVQLAGDCSIDSLIDVDHESFQKPCDMPAAIDAYLRQTHQPLPKNPGETARIILQSLALKYRAVAGKLRVLMPSAPTRLHVVGGGSQNRLLNQFTADALSLPVEAGPIEATGAGNILAQMIATREITSLAEGRTLLRKSFVPEVFEPGDSTFWDRKAEAFAKL
jgi:rhamnulokinase